MMQVSYIHMRRKVVIYSYMQTDIHLSLEAYLLQLLSLQVYIHTYICEVSMNVYEHVCNRCDRVKKHKHFQCKKRNVHPKTLKNEHRLTWGKQMSVH
jgi:hypothetical protein